MENCKGFEKNEAKGSLSRARARIPLFGCKKQLSYYYYYIFMVVFLVVNRL